MATNEENGKEPNSEEILRLKVRLLTEGATIPKKHGSGRKGGAGPSGAKYFLLPNGRSCGIPIRRGRIAKKYNAAVLEPTDLDGIWLYDSKYSISEVPTPEFYGKATEDGIEYNKLALLHGTECIATTVLQSCRYWETGDQCKFCTIPNSHISGNTLLEKTPSQIAEIVRESEAAGVTKNVLLTTGTPDNPDSGIGRLAKIARGIRDVSKIPIAVQFEPPEDLSLIKEISDAGVNAVGIHIESFDDEIRERICPGKFRYASLDKYQAAWERALQFFDKGDVSTFVLYGLGEDEEITLQHCQSIASKGVLPIVTPVRPAPGSQLADYIPSYVNRLDATVEFYKRYGSILYNNLLNPRLTVGGCSRCGACTPIQEAYEWAESQ
ncbi:MAG: radical SAM protein [Candidatus Thorarchaeota archaeon]|jgi:radical SAM protein (TIGR04043 family)